jgi:Cd2+/Zn2+-exporting ATPase
MKKQIISIVIGSLLFAMAIFLNINESLKFSFFIISYVIVGVHVVYRAIRNLLNGNIFNEYFLMSIATIGAFLIGEHPEGVAVMLFYLIGETFQKYAVDKSRKSIANLMDIRPDYANVKRGSEFVRVNPNEVKIGDVVVIKAGEKIPLDGKIIEGTTMVDTAALTGETIPREKNVSDEVLSGSINISGVITVEILKEFGESTVSKILDLVENASSKKSKSEQFITKFAKYYTPTVVIVAVLLAIIPPFILRETTFNEWIYRALSFLVVSCPCALVISIPLSFFGGIGRASNSGILIKGSNYLEALAKAEIIVFDKTGTLTKGVFNVQEIYPVNISKEELLELAAYTENYSNHPISLSLKRAYGKNIDTKRILNVEEISGYGVSATIDGKKILAGNSKLMDKMNISYEKGQYIGTKVYVAINNDYAGCIIISDEIKKDSIATIRKIKNAGIKQILMLTGDTKAISEKIAKELEIDKVYSELLPNDKVEKVEEIFKGKSQNGSLIFVGDGINDAPVLARADIGIAMGGVGSDAAIEAADIVIMNDELSRIPSAIKIAQKTLKVANQNITISIAIKITILALSMVGIATLWSAVFADVGVTIIAVFNALRVLNLKKI